MTQNEIVEELKKAGGKEFPCGHLHSTPGVRMFDFGRIDGPNCLCNDRPPSLHVMAWPDMTLNSQQITGTIKFQIFGESPFGWLDFSFYGIEREKAVDKIQEAKRILGESWAKTK